MIPFMVLPSIIQSDKALPQAAAILMAAQDVLAQSQVGAFVPVARASAAKTQGRIVAAQKLRRTPKAPSQSMRKSSYFTKIARKTHLQTRPYAKASAILMAASKRHAPLPQNPFERRATAPVTDILSIINQRAQAVLIRDVLLRRFAENDLDMRDGKTDLPRLIDAEKRKMRPVLRQSFKLAI